MISSRLLPLFGLQAVLKEPDYTWKHPHDLTRFASTAVQALCYDEKLPGGLLSRRGTAIVWKEQA